MSSMLNRGRDPYLMALTGVLALNLLLKWVFFCGLNQADDFSYGVYAFTMFRDIWPWGADMDFRMLRFGIMLPVALFTNLLTPTELTAVLYPMLVSLGTIVLVYLTGRRLYGPNAGLLAALMLAVLPGDVVFGTMLLPDIVVPFYLALSIWTFLRAEDREERGGHTWYIVSGFSLFLAFITRENSYYFLLFYLPWAFNAERWRRGLYLMGVAFVLPVIAMYGFYWLKTGDFLYNVHLATEARDTQVASGYIPANAVNRFTQLYYMMPVFIGRGGFLSPMFGLTFYIGLPSLVFVSMREYVRGRRWRLLAPWWMLAGYLILEFGSLSFTDYQMMKKLPRFLLTVTPAVALGVGYTLNAALGLGERTIRRVRDIRLRWATAVPAFIVVAVMVFTSLGVASRQKASRDAFMEQFRWGYGEVLAGRPHRPVYGTGGWWFNKLSFYFLPDLDYVEVKGRPAPKLRQLGGVTDPDGLAGSYVLIDRKHFTGQNDMRIQHSYDDFPAVAVLPPEDWMLLGMRYNVEIYEVPDTWRYTAADEESMPFDILRAAVRTGDPMRFLYCLHPDFLGTLDRNGFFALFQRLTGMDDGELEAFIVSSVRAVGTGTGDYKLMLDIQQRSQQ